MYCRIAVLEHRWVDLRPFAFFIKKVDLNDIFFKIKGIIYLGKCT